MNYFKWLAALVALALLGAALTGSLSDWGFWVAGAVGSSVGYWLRGGGYEPGGRRSETHQVNSANGMPMAGPLLDIQGHVDGFDK